MVVKLISRNDDPIKNNKFVYLYDCCQLKYSHYTLEWIYNDTNDILRFNINGYFIMELPPKSLTKELNFPIYAFTWCNPNFNFTSESPYCGEIGLKYIPDDERIYKGKWQGFSYMLGLGLGLYKDGDKGDAARIKEK